MARKKYAIVAGKCVEAPECLNPGSSGVRLWQWKLADGQGKAFPMKTFMDRQIDFENRTEIEQRPPVVIGKKYRCRVSIQDGEYITQSIDEILDAGSKPTDAVSYRNSPRFQEIREANWQVGLVDAWDKDSRGIRRLSWIRREDAVFWVKEKVYVSQVEYSQENLGAAEVNRLVREMTGGSPLRVDPKAWGKYRRELLEMAAYAAGEVIMDKGGVSLAIKGADKHDAERYFTRAGGVAAHWQDEARSREEERGEGLVGREQQERPGFSGDGL